MTFPLVLGSGRRLFNEGILPVTMRPVDVTTTHFGVVLGTRSSRSDTPWRDVAGWSERWG